MIDVFTGTQQYETAVAEGLHQSCVQMFTPHAFLSLTGAIASLANSPVVFALRIVVTRLARRLEAVGDRRRIVDERPRKVVVEWRGCRPSLG